MAKSPETRDRFRIFAETSSEAMGPLLAQLTRMGLENIGYELVSDVHSFASRPRIEHGSSAEEFASEWIAEHPTFKVSELGRHFSDHGRSVSTSHYITRKMAKDGKLTDLGNGNYRRADIREIAPPAPDKKSRSSKGRPVPSFDITGEQSIRRHLRNRKKFTMAELRTLFRAQGRTETSASPIVSKMLKRKMLRMIGDGEYEVLKLSAPKVAKRNGKADADFRKRDRERKQAYRANKKAEQQPGPSPDTETPSHG